MTIKLGHLVCGGFYHKMKKEEALSPFMHHITCPRCYNESIIEIIDGKTYINLKNYDLRTHNLQTWFALAKYENLSTKKRPSIQSQALYFTS